MRQAKTMTLTGYLAALLFSIILTACGGGTQELQSGNTDTPPADQGGGTPPPTDPLPTGNLSVSLSWLPPLTYTDGSDLSATLQGHNIYMKSGSGNFVRIHTLSTTATATYLVENLSSGTYTFAVTAFDNNGVESGFSNTVTVTL